MGLISATSIIDLLLNEINFLKKRRSILWKITVYERSGFHTSSPIPQKSLHWHYNFSRNIAKMITALTPIGKNWKPSDFEQVVLVNDKLKLLKHVMQYKGLPGHQFVKLYKIIFTSLFCWLEHTAIYKIIFCIFFQIK